MKLALAVAFLVLAPSVLHAGSTIHVPGDVATIQGAIAIAQNGDTVLVAPGTYDEELDFLGKAIAVRSEAGAQTTILTNVNAAVSFVNGEGPGSVLHGFTVTGNNNSLHAAIYSPGASPLIQRCVIRDNHSSVSAAAGVFGDPTLEDCRIEDNLNGNGTAGVYGAPTLRRCILSGNQGYDAAALYLTGGRLEDCQVVGNSSEEGSSGGAVSISSVSVVVLEHCLIARNVKSTWGGMYSAQGAGLSISPTSPPASLVNCSVVDNRVTVPGFYGPDYGGIAGPATLVNCIVRGNDGLQLSGPSASYSDVEGGLPGLGNFDLDPLFRDAPNGDYRLLPGSPCIDTGDPAAPLDADGSRADVGAFAFAHAVAFVRNGTGVNPLLLASVTPPAIGTNWLASIDPTLVGGVQFSGIRVQTAALQPGVLVPAGEILIGGAVLAGVIQPSNGVLDTFPFGIPNDLALLGLEVHAQGFVRSVSGFRLGNALRVLVGQ